jgi:hypothetical protein
MQSQPLFAIPKHSNRSGGMFAIRIPYLQQ